MLIHQRKVTALGLLLLVAMPLFFSAGLMVKQKALRIQRRARLEREVLETITLRADKVHWIKPGKEILVDGKMFDVKSYRSLNGKISFTGFFDKEEDKLIGRINQLTEQKKEDKSPLTQFAVKLLFAPVYTEPVPLSVQDPWHAITRHFVTYSEEILPGFHPLHIPPPKHC